MFISDISSKGLAVRSTNDRKIASGSASFNLSCKYETTVDASWAVKAMGRHGRCIFSIKVNRLPYIPVEFFVRLSNSLFSGMTTSTRSTIAASSPQCPSSVTDKIRFSFIWVPLRVVVICFVTCTPPFTSCLISSFILFLVFSSPLFLSATALAFTFLTKGLLSLNSDQDLKNCFWKSI